MDTTTLTAGAIRDGIARAIAVIGLAGVALIHLVDTPGAFESTTYRGWLYVGLILSCVATAGALIRDSDPRAWFAAALLPAVTLFAFVVSRTVGLPQGADDIGNWTEPLGLASLFVEGSLVSLCAGVFLARAGSVAVSRARSSPELARG
jgi:hypothetical protein